MAGLRYDGPERVLVEPKLGFVPTVGSALITPTRTLTDGTREVLQHFRYQGGNVAVEVGRQVGTGECEIQVSDYVNGRGSRFGVRKLQSRLVVVEGFGPPRRGLEAAEHPTEQQQAPYAAEHPRVEPAPAAPKESPMQNPPFVPQTMFEAAGAAGSRQDPLLAQLLAHVLTQATQGQSQQSSELRELLRKFESKLEDQRTQAAASEGVAQSLTRTDARLGRLETGQAQILELVTKLVQALEGTPIHTVEQVRSLTQRLGPETFGLSANATPAGPGNGLSEFVGWLLEMAEPFMPMLQTMFQQWLVSKAAQAAGATAPAPAESAAVRPAVRPFGHGRVQRPVNGNGHASAPEPDTGA